MIIDALLIALLIARPSFELAAWVAALIAIRHTPALAISVAHLLKLDTYDGWTVRLAAIMLPPLAAFMSTTAAPIDQSVTRPPTVPVPSTTDTKAIGIPAHDITKDGWIAALAAAKDEKGEFLFGANRIFAAVGGHRATVLAMVKAIQEPDDSPQYKTSPEQQQAREELGL